MEYRKAKWADVVKYSFGGLGSNLAFILAMSYLTFFYTDIFGIPTMVVSGLMLISRFIDAFTDPLMGMLGDHTVSKWGKFRPWIMAGAPFLGVLIWLLFTAPDLSPTMKIVYAYVVYIAYSLASTVVNIPYHSLTPVLSDDPQQRTVIVSFKQGMGTISQLIITVLALPLVNAFGGGAAGWSRYGALIGVMTCISFWICAWGGKPYDKCETKKTDAPKMNMLKDLQLLVKNKPMLMLMIAFGTDVLANACTSAANMYYFKYVLGREDLVPTTSMITLVTSVIAIFCLPVLTRLLGKKKLYWLGSACSCIPLLIMWIRPTAGTAILMGSLAAFGFISRFPANLGWAMLPECSDYAEWKFGQRADGLMSSSLTFINKFGMAIGGFLASFLLGLVGFVANQEQTQACLNMIVFLRWGTPIIGYLCSLASMWFYELTDDKTAMIRRELEERKHKNA
ncbi:MAG: MFS transporter [Lachnospiraceae bacterium]|nr:MFS transporter [Lachnospiraceae bacterium]